MSKIKNLQLIVISILYCWVTLSLAESPSRYQLDVMTVTATPGQSKKINEVQASVEVIDRARLQALSIQSVPQLLQYVTGVAIVDSGATSSFRIRGTNSGQSLLLVNGLRRTSKFGQPTPTILSVEAIERIEIIRGPLSALYGADALGGVINIISKNPAGVFSGNAAYNYGVAELGERETHLFRGSINSPELELGFVNTSHRISLETRHRDPYSFDKSSPVTNLTGSEKYFANYTGMFNFTPDRSLKLSGEYLNQNDKGTILDGQRLPSPRFDKEIRYQIDAIFTDEYEFGNFSVSLGHGNSEASAIRSDRTVETTDYTLTELNGLFSTSPLDNMVLTIGAGGRWEDINISNFSRGEETREVANVFSQVDWELISDVHLVAGVRYDDFSDFGDSINPRASLGWTPGPFSLRVGYREGFRAPPFSQLYSNIERVSRLTGIIFRAPGNPNLGSESSETIEASAGYNFDFDAVQGNIEFTYHTTDISDQIELISTTTEFDAFGRPTVFNFEYDNVTKAKIQGYELVINANIYDFWSVFASYEYLDAKNDVTKAPLLDRARHTYRVQNTFNPYKDLQLHANARFIRDFLGEDINRTQVRANHYEVDLKLDYRLHQNLLVFAGIDNLTDRLPPVAIRGRGGLPDDPGERYYYVGFETSF